MTTALRLALTAIVLVNLAFVHATEDASLSWLAPMYAAVLASPWLARHSGRTAYRWGWNLAVVAIFAVLVRHTALAGPRYLLEDGLRLAAVCQVHVLCTLGTRQKPDLLFFNSFLIAVVTAFLTQDALYSVVFLAYAPLLVVGLSLYAAERSGESGAVLRDGLRHAAVALVVTGLVFFAWPRDFRRKGLVVEQLALGPAHALDVGFSEEVRTDRTGDIGSSDAVVLRARVLSGEANLSSTYWRGATQVTFEDERWIGGAADLGDPRWHESGPRDVSRALRAGGPVLDVDLVDASAGRLFAPLATRRATFASVQADDDPPGWFADATLRIPSHGGVRGPHQVQYHLELAAEGPWPGGTTPAPLPDELLPAVSLGSGRRIDAVARLADDLRRGLAPASPQHVVVEAMRARLASRTDYLAPGSPLAARNVAEFVEGRAGGHCEHFATALALLLRHAGIPCRMATGYVSDEWNEPTRTLTVRRRDAHAWVEVRDPQAGWYAVDPTPATAKTARGEASLVARIRDWFTDAWERIVRFDDEARDAAVAWFREAPSRAAEILEEEPLACGGTALVVVALVLTERLRRAHAVPAGVREYRACLRRLRLTPRPGETPRDLVARAAAEGLAKDAIERIEAATRRHESERYARR